MAISEGGFFVRLEDAYQMHGIEEETRLYDAFIGKHPTVSGVRTYYAMLSAVYGVPPAPESLVLTAIEQEVH